MRREAARKYSLEHRSRSVELKEKRNEQMATRERLKRAKSRNHPEEEKKSYSELNVAREHIMRLWGDRDGSPPRSLPSENELSWEIRNMEAIRRIYKERGFDL